MQSQRLLDPEERLRFTELLPWHLNGTLGADEKGWMERACRDDPWAALALKTEERLSMAVAADQPRVPADLGLPELRRMVTTSAPSSPPLSSRSAAPAQPWRQRLASMLEGLLPPPLAVAALLLVMVQAGVILSMLGGQDDTPTEQMRSASGRAPFAAVRIVFQPGTSEASFRSLLAGSGAQIVGGPSQLGEYWVTSAVRSPDELLARLKASPLVANASLDPAGAPASR